MDEARFKEQFIAAFLATWVAQNYGECCYRGTQERLEHPPVEDAKFLADAAWDEIKEKLLGS